MKSQAVDPHAPAPPAARRGGTAGIAVLEATAALAILTIALLAMTTTSVTVYKLKESDRLRRVATVGLQSLVEDVHALASAENDDGWARAIVDACAAGGALDEPEVRELEPWPGETSVFTVTVVTDETMTDAELEMDLGMPRDLDNDGSVTNADVTDGASMLPVIARARWVGRNGNRQLVQGFYVLRY